MKRLILCFILILALVISVSAFTTASISKGYGGSGWGVAVNCSDKWSGSVTGDATVSKVTGTGYANYTVKNPIQSISAHMKKDTNSSSLLVVDVLKDGKIVESRKTNTSFGVILLPISVRNFK